MSESDSLNTDAVPSTSYGTITELARSSDSLMSLNANDSSLDANDISKTHFPMLQMALVGLILFKDAVSTTILNPFIFFMVRDLNLSEDEKGIGYYVGWITAVYFFTQFVTSTQWGSASDKYGRRPMLLLGLIGNAIACTSFGLSKSFWWALFSRGLCGALNGNTPIARTMVRELSTDETHVLAHSIHGFAWSLGVIAGPILSGYLCWPAERFPSLFGDNEFLIEYPYFLPCFVASIISIVGFVVGYFFLEETNEKVIERKKMKKDVESQYLISDITLPRDSEQTEPSFFQRVKKNPLYLVTGIFLYFTWSISTFYETYSALTHSSFMVIISHSISAFHSIIFIEMLPLYLCSPSSVGGLSGDINDLAHISAIAGAFQLVFQIAIFPKLKNYFTLLGLARAALILFGVVYALFPMLTSYKEWLETHMMNESTRIFKVTYSALVVTRYLGNPVLNTSFPALLNNSVDKESAGRVNGFYGSCLALMRMLGPIIGGFLWSTSLEISAYPFDYHFIYYFIGTLALVGLLQTYFIPGSLERRI